MAAKKARRSKRATKAERAKKADRAQRSKGSKIARSARTSSEEPKARGGLRASAIEGRQRASEASDRARDFARRARASSVARVRDLGAQARDRMTSSGLGAGAAAGTFEPHLCFVQSPRRPIPPLIMPETVRVATYNVHRWQGVNGRAQPDIAKAGRVIEELDADVIALQEVLRPFPEDAPLPEDAPREDPLGLLCDELDLHLAFAVTRRHRRGELGNAILSRYPITSISVLDISHSRIERRGALAAQVGHAGAGLGVVATHLSLVDRTRHRQVQSLLEHPALNSGPAILMGDMNAWRNCKGSQALEDSLGLHHNFDWPPSFPAGRPTFALDRIYVRSAEVVGIMQHDTPAARKASDHLPVVAEIKVEKAGVDASS